MSHSQALGRGQTAPRDQKQVSWLKRVLNKVLPDQPGAPVRDAIDPQQFALAMKFGDLLRDAPYRDLPPPLRTRLRAPAEAALDDGDLVTAARAIGKFTAAVKRLAPDFAAWQQAAGRLATTERQVGELEKLQWPDATGFRDRLAAIGQDAAQGDFAVALQGLGIIEAPVAQALPKATARAKWLAETALLRVVEQQVGELPGLGAADADTHKASLVQIKAKAESGDFDGALAGLTTLAPLAAASRTKANYQAQREAMADDEQAVRRIGDTPPALKALRDKYLASAAVTQQFAATGSFADAFNSLPQLEADLKAALAARRTRIEAETKATVDAAKTALFADSSNGKKAWKDVGSDEWKAAVDKVLKGKLDEDFQARYDKVCEQVADDLAKDPLVKEAFKDWQDWTQDPAGNADKIKKVMEKVLAVQSKRLGLEPPTPVDTYSDPTDPADCGGFSGSTGKISLNVSSGDFGSFKELLDTLTHENTHAYQEKLIRDFRAGKITPGSPDYAAAMVLEMNDSEGYVSPDESREYKNYCNTHGLPVQSPYMTQVCEQHAWGAGRKAGRAAYKAIKKAPTQP